MAFHKKQHDAAKVETGLEKTRSAHFEQALEEHRSLLARLEAEVARGKYTDEDGTSAVTLGVQT